MVADSVNCPNIDSAKIVRYNTRQTCTDTRLQSQFNTPKNRWTNSERLLSQTRDIKKISLKSPKLSINLREITLTHSSTCYLDPEKSSTWANKVSPQRTWSLLSPLSLLKKFYQRIWQWQALLGQVLRDPRRRLVIVDSNTNLTS